MLWLNNTPTLVFKAVCHPSTEQIIWSGVLFSAMQLFYCSLWRCVISLYSSTLVDGITPKCGSAMLTFTHRGHRSLHPFGPVYKLLSPFLMTAWLRGVLSAWEDKMKILSPAAFQVNSPQHLHMVHIQCKKKLRKLFYPSLYYSK